MAVHEVWILHVSALIVANACIAAAGGNRLIYREIGQLYMLL